MSILSWLRGDSEPYKEPMEAKLQGQPDAKGELVKDSPTWIFVRNWASKELEAARKKNDNPLKDQVGTAVTRGQIMCLKTILDLPNPPMRPVRALRGRSGILEKDLDDEYPEY